MTFSRHARNARGRTTCPLLDLWRNPTLVLQTTFPVTRDAYKLKPRTRSPKPEQVSAERYICLIFMDPLSSPSSELAGLNAFNHVGGDVMFDSLSRELVVNCESVGVNYSRCPWGFENFSRWLKWCSYMLNSSGFSEMSYSVRYVKKIETSKFYKVRLTVLVFIQSQTLHWLKVIFSKNESHHVCLFALKIWSE